VLELPDDCQDVQVLEAATRDQPREAVRPLASGAWDALAGVRRGVMAVADLRREPEDADAGILAAPAPDVRVRDAWSLPQRRSVQQAQWASEAELYTRDAVQSVERSCAVLAAEAVLQPEVAPLVAVELLSAAMAQMRSPRALPEPAALPQQAARGAVVL
jgi:hypothetical protein